MIIYNVTLNIDQSIEKEWFTWMKEVHIHEVLATGKFLSCRFSKILSHQEEGSQGYSVQYLCESPALLDLYYRDDAPRLREDGKQRFGEKMLAFRTELEVVDDFFPINN